VNSDNVAVKIAVTKSVGLMQHNRTAYVRVDVSETLGSNLGQGRCTLTRVFQSRI